ncbi:MAG: FAD-binding oxidoreductase [Candidatus Promineifilaceae bacterium]
MDSVLTHSQLSLSDARLERVMPWGGAQTTVGWVFRPNTTQGIADIFPIARQNNLTVGFRGGGNSYGDAACNEAHIVLDLTRCKRILDWDPRSGQITVEPGLTLRELWEYVLADGYWPPVCTGTMYVTIGGAASMNVHGKNAYKVGTFGDHILSFELMLPNGEIIACSRDENSDIFHAAIGGFGMLGCFTSITMQMKRVHSGSVKIEAIASRNLGEMFAQFRHFRPKSDYMVGWVDCASTDAIGRGQIHVGRHFKAGEDPYPQQSFQLEKQHLSDTLFGIVPRSAMWRFMRPFFNSFGIPYVNMGKYYASVLKDGEKYTQPHAQFHFLLNYFPGWKKAAGNGGLIQYQPFVPDESAEEVFTKLIEISQARGLISYLGVLKRHRSDPFLMTHGLDGWSLALDFAVNDQNRDHVRDMCYEMDELVVAAGGRFYPAKDSTLRPEIAQAYLGIETVNRFRTLKLRCDPEGVLQGNFWRRVFG